MKIAWIKIAAIWWVISGVLLQCTRCDAAQGVLDAMQAELRIRDHLASLRAHFSAPAWRDVDISRLQRVEQTKNQPYQTGLTPVWIASLSLASEEAGYVMCEDTTDAALVDFAWAATAVPNAESGKLLQDVPNLQQFPVPGTLAPRVASGCVPTAAANLLGYWMKHGYPTWSDHGPDVDQPALRRLTTRLRALLPMQEIADTCGYTDNGMPVSGAFPEDLRAALSSDALAHGLSVNVSLERFSLEGLQQETALGRPTLSSCIVRLPHKPGLSWGHEVTSIGWSRVGTVDFVGVRDNFFPVKPYGESPKGLTDATQAVRWIRTDAFQSLLRVEIKN
jgi:hypothetical protein